MSAAVAEASCATSASDTNDLKTSSSILDFLNQERNCCWSDIPEDGSASAAEVDIEGIFAEINRLSGKIHESRSVDEILQEAETLILSQAPIQLKCMDDKWLPDTPDVLSKEFPPPATTADPERDKRERTFIAPQSKSEPHLSKLSIPAESIEAPLAMPTADAVAETTAAATTMVTFDDLPLHPQPASMSSSIYSPTNSYARERALESEITALQDKLKDTEERYHAVRLKYDALRLQYRDVKEQQSSALDETDRLRLDLKHLNDCASALRSEIHVARDDRAEALRLQGVLQTELDSCRGEKKRLAEQSQRDARNILDLQRQCKEMEKILTRKHPDSVSALIVAAKGLPPVQQAKENAEASRKVLEQRIVQLERDAAEQDAKAQKILGNVQTKFSAIQEKYETHIADLETQVLSLQEINSTLNKKIVSLADALDEQKTEERQRREREIVVEAERRRPIVEVTTRSTQTVAKASNLPRAVSANSVAGGKVQSGGNDNDSTHLLATIRGMRVDLAIKEKALQRLTRELEECKRTMRKLKEMSCKIPLQSTTAASHKKPYDPMQFTEKVDNGTLKEAHHKLKLLEFDYKALHDKRLQDLKTLQAAHERELSSCQETVRILQQRLAEGDEAQKRRRVPVDYYALKAKVTNLEVRHSEREDRLHMLVEALSKGRLSGLLDEALLKSTGSGSESTVSPNSD